MEILDFLIPISNNYRTSSNDQFGYYDYSFNNNYLLFQNPPPTSYNSYDYGSSSTYPEYNSLPPSYSTASHQSTVLGSSYRHSSASNYSDSKSMIKNETQNDSISLEKLQSIVHVQSINQQSENTLSKDERRDFEKNLSSQ